MNVVNQRRVLCVFPAYTPSFGTFAHAYRLMRGMRAFMPPQGREHDQVGDRKDHKDLLRRSA